MTTAFSWNEGSVIFILWTVLLQIFEEYFKIIELKSDILFLAKINKTIDGSPSVKVSLA